MKSNARVVKSCSVVEHVGLREVMPDLNGQSGYGVEISVEQTDVRCYDISLSELP